MGVGAVVVLLSEGEILLEIWVEIGFVVRDLSEDLVGSDVSLRNAFLMVDLAGGCCWINFRMEAVN